jgi:hypothetical protein
MFAYGNDGHVYSTHGTQNANPIHPVVMLRNDVVYTSGDGTRDNPYKLESWS